jgi:phage gp46-like protein
MPDIRIVQNTFFPKYSVTCDWNLLADGTLDETEALATAVVVALGTDALADVSDVLPDPDSTDRMGWWGNLDAGEIWNAWDLGCLLWLHKRDKITPSQSMYGATVQRVEYHIRSALQPFVDQRICSSYDVWVERTARDTISALIRIYRGPTLEVNLRYQILWEGIERVNDNYNIGRIANPLSAPIPIP